MNSKKTVGRSPTGLVKIAAGSRPRRGRPGCRGSGDPRSAPAPRRSARAARGRRSRSPACPGTPRPRRASRRRCAGCRWWPAPGAGRRAAVELEVLVDLRLLLGDRRLVERELHPVVAVGDDLGHQRGVVGGDVVADELRHVHEAHDLVVEADPVVHLAELDVADRWSRAWNSRLVLLALDGAEVRSTNRADRGRCSADRSTSVCRCRRRRRSRRSARCRARR